jgi:hypothetical protein
MGISFCESVDFFQIVVHKSGLKKICKDWNRQFGKVLFNSFNMNSDNFQKINEFNKSNESLVL